MSTAGLLLLIVASIAGSIYVLHDAAKDRQRLGHAPLRFDPDAVLAFFASLTRPTDGPGEVHLSQRQRSWLTCGTVVLAIASAAMLLFMPPAKAETWLNLGGVTWHAEPGFNGINPALGLQYRWDGTWAVEGGVLRNSERHTSAYAVGIYTPLHLGRLHAGVAAGAITGYAWNDRRPMPFGAAVLEHRWQTVSIAALYLPRVERLKSTDAVALQLRIRF